MADLEDNWERLVQQPAEAAALRAPKLIVVYSPFRRLFGPLVQVVSDLQQANPKRDIAVVVPELVRTRWYHYLLHNHTATVIKAYLLFSGFRRVVVINVPGIYLRRMKTWLVLETRRSAAIELCKGRLVIFLAIEDAER